MTPMFRSILAGGDSPATAHHYHWMALDPIGRTFPTRVRCDYCDNRGWVGYRTGEEEDCPVCGGGAGLLTWCVVNKRYRLKLNRSHETAA